MERTESNYNEFISLYKDSFLSPLAIPKLEQLIKLGFEFTYIKEEYNGNVHIYPIIEYKGEKYKLIITHSIGELFNFSWLTTSENVNIKTHIFQNCYDNPFDELPKVPKVKVPTVKKINDLLEICHLESLIIKKKKAELDNEETEARAYLNNALLSNKIVKKEIVKDEKGMFDYVLQTEDFTIRLVFQDGLLSKKVKIKPLDSDFVDKILDI